MPKTRITNAPVGAPTATRARDEMSTKHHYSVSYTRKSRPDSICHTTRLASSASEARNLVKSDEARRWEIVTIIACVKR